MKIITHELRDLSIVQDFINKVVKTVDIKNIYVPHAIIGQKKTYADFRMMYYIGHNARVCDVICYNDYSSIIPCGSDRSNGKITFKYDKIYKQSIYTDAFYHKVKIVNDFIIKSWNSYLQPEYCLYSSGQELLNTEKIDNQIHKCACNINQLMAKGCQCGGC